jgi:hypothetical protein
VHHTTWDEKFGGWYEDVEPPRQSKCGFCGKGFESWSERMVHVGAHYKQKAKIEEWKGGWGLDEAWMRGRLQGAMLPEERVKVLEAEAGG